MLICRVWDDRMVNLGGFDYGGEPLAATSVTLVQEGDVVPTGQSYATWPKINFPQPPAPPAPAGLSDADIEAEIQRKGLTAPRITPTDIEAVIMDEDYHVFPDTTVTVCILKLANGFSVTGESACASPKNFDRKMGAKIARQNARDKIWALEGYLLRERLMPPECKRT
jgi:hypothetical protein